MSKNIFYAPPPAWSDDAIRLDGSETHHLRVLRLAPGAEITVIDGEGRIAQCRVLRMERRGATLGIISSRLEPRGDSRAIIALALSKATRRGFFMEKAVELGAFAIWIWQADNSQGRMPRDFAAHIKGQLEAGAKQCGNPWLPGVRTFDDLQTLLSQTGDIDYRLLPLERQEGQPLPDMEMLGRAGTTIYLIGPEGGFSDAEIAALLSRAFTPISLGERILRCETAAVLCLGLHYWASQALSR